MANRKSFDTDSKNTLSDDVLIEGNKNYSNNAFDKIIKKNENQSEHGIKNNEDFKLNHKKTEKKVNTKKNMGRPIEITDSRMKVSIPKKVSPYVSQKINTLQPFITELSDVKGRITFDKELDVLIEFYITHKLGMAKEELFRKQFEKDFENLKS